MRQSSSSGNESTEDGPRNIIISSGSVKVETGIRIFDPDSGIDYIVETCKVSLISLRCESFEYFCLLANILP